RAEGAHHAALAGHVAVQDVAEAGEQEHESGAEEGAAAQHQRGEQRQAQAQDGQMIRRDPACGEKASDGTNEVATLVLPALAQAFSSTPSASAASGAPPTTSTNSPRGDSASTHCKSERSVPRRVSSNFLVSSRESEAGR